MTDLDPSPIFNYKKIRFDIYVWLYGNNNHSLNEKRLYTDFDLKTFVDKNTPKKHKTLKHDKTLNITNENSN